MYVCIHLLPTVPVNILLKYNYEGVVIVIVSQEVKEVMCRQKEETSNFETIGSHSYIDCYDDFKTVGKIIIFVFFGTSK